MHILYLHQYFCPPGGSGNNRSYELAQHWVAAGHRVTMVTSAAYFPQSFQFESASKQFDCDGIEVHALNLPYAHMMSFWQRVRAFFRFYKAGLAYAKRLPKPDLIYASSTPPTVGELGRKLARRWGVPYVFETVDVWPDVPIGMGIVRNKLLISWLHRRTNRIYRDAAAIVALSDGMRTQILAHGIAPDKVQVHYNGTNLAAFPFVERPLRAGTHIVYTGTVGVANGADVILRLCKRLLARGRTDIRVTILGGGNALAQVKALAAELDVPNLAFLDTVPKEQVAALLAEADIGLVTFAPFPVLEANSANKFYDYLASGLPVVINYGGWQADYLQRYGCGLSAPMGNLESLVEQVVALADAPQRRLEMGKNARQLAEQCFDRKVIAGNLMILFQEIVAR